ncbi:MAG: TIGR03617 family F420-dependent LLM class oxidoreductase [Myxococcota bacterium]
MQVYATMDQRLPLGQVEAYARRVEAMGYDGLNVPDATHDGLLAAQAALRGTTRLKAATSVLVCFPRSPMTVAIAAWDLQSASGGRFELGLGSQVRGNVTGRYGTPWTPPVPRMREYVESLRAIFDCFQNDAPLRYEGEHYRFTRMQPFFHPGPLDAPPPPIWLGAIGPRMTALAGRVADGLMTHPTNASPRFLREVALPAVAQGAKRAGRDPSEIELLAGPMVITGADDAELAAQREYVREMLTFLYSTPAYWPSLELFGWKEVGERLHRLTREGRWDDLRGAVSDEMLDALAPAGRYDEIGDVLRDAYGGLAARINFPVPKDPARDADAARAIAVLREAS